MGNQKASINFKSKRNLLVDLLQELADDPGIIDHDDQVKGLISKIYKTARKQRRRKVLDDKTANDLEQIKSTEIFRINDEFAHEEQVKLLGSVVKEQNELMSSKKCYCCKKAYRQLHFFYHQLCPKCAEFNYQKRANTCDLSGYRALVTGGRIKIGFETALKLLRSGAETHITTRFPKNALDDFKRVHDYSLWNDRLFIHGLDLRNIPSVQDFINYLKNQLSSLDIIINNAAQTIKRPYEYYQHLISKEETNYLISNSSSLLPNNDQMKNYFPVGMMDNHNQQVDLRDNNSWSSTLEEVGLMEMLEVQLVNVTAPFLLNSGLKSLLMKSSNPNKFIVNVSAMEGQFNRKNKTVFHPHTNMAKASLNMMTRTSAEDYAGSNIFMTSVDTGWITDENPFPKRERMRNNGFVPPLDIIDGASRVFAPIADGVNKPESIMHGVFLKDYHPTDW
ncbi:SDR family oxidoreductase [Aureibacter tunicatorum]|uniref:NAD(P)-dependent dehydrogenase (Short-subunit alcohol dehydrogenase family) n=1 Tax=Aureibacter tunicatorum TaxID=866807 RepID=A0AAE3XQ92_9BACT|nr:SDR family oxidoreductase [Aureibacter tunicatorum]MDR6240098.1 NAD(P)-dependent dehydrogenase (short-subunit alcohol dehydrogenase family) [Aureibacter tunicatorum]BDD04569.1 oxidoreductase [Aureibacter tunicatorum]